MWSLSESISNETTRASARMRIHKTQLILPCLSSAHQRMSDFCFSLPFFVRILFLPHWCSILPVFASYPQFALSLFCAMRNNNSFECNNCLVIKESMIIKRHSFLHTRRFQNLMCCCVFCSLSPASHFFSLRCVK